MLYYHREIFQKRWLSLGRKVPCLTAALVNGIWIQNIMYVEVERGMGRTLSVSGLKGPLQGSRHLRITTIPRRVLS